jgi:putative glutamine amidotransferase
VTATPPRIGLSCYPRVVDISTGPTLLHTLSRWYVERIIDAGGLPLLLPVVAGALAPAFVEGLDGLLLTGGGDIDPDRYHCEPEAQTAGTDERRDAFEIALALAALEARLPVLAICRGIQVLNVARGGTLVQHVPKVTGANHLRSDVWSLPVHDVRLAADSRLADFLGTDTVSVNSLHHQAVDSVGDGVRAVGWGPDGTIEAVEVDGHPEVVAVQWHPELLAGDPVSARLFAGLVAAAQRPIST